MAKATIVRLSRVVSAFLLACARAELGFTSSVSDALLDPESDGSSNSPMSADRELNIWESGVSGRPGLLWLDRLLEKVTASDS
jgi:hypothetical protein